MLGERRVSCAGSAYVEDVRLARVLPPAGRPAGARLPPLGRQSLRSRVPREALSGHGGALPPSKSLVSSLTLRRSHSRTLAGRHMLTQLHSPRCTERRAAAGLRVFQLYQSITTRCRRCQLPSLAKHHNKSRHLRAIVKHIANLFAIFSRPGRPHGLRASCSQSGLTIRS